MINARQAKSLRERNNRHEAWSKQFIKPNGWTVITKEEQATCPRNARMTNEQRGKLEQFEVLRDKPRQLVAYYKLVDLAGNPSGYTAKDVCSGCMVQVHVWTGDVLGKGRVTSLAAWRSNFGDRRVNIRVKIADCWYAGTAFLDAGDYCRLRRCK